jgi:hypothetical protein
MGPGVELLTAVMRHYQQITGRHLSADRVMAWHLRTALGDALWRSEAGIPLADHRTPPEWVDDLAARFTMLGIDPQAPPAANRAPGTSDPLTAPDFRFDDRDSESNLGAVRSNISAANDIPGSQVGSRQRQASGYARPQQTGTVAG